jgi:hypothetical protein
MGDDVLVAILNRVIADLEQRKRQQIAEFMAAHAASSLAEAEDAEEDPEIAWTLYVIDEITALRKNVLEGVITK